VKTAYAIFLLITSKTVAYFPTSRPMVGRAELRKMDRLKTNKINPASFARIGATCGQSLFAYRPAANDLTKETPPPR
jgi:hypothetical protein